MVYFCNYSKDDKNKWKNMALLTMIFKKYLTKGLLKANTKFSVIK